MVVHYQNIQTNQQQKTLNKILRFLQVFSKMYHNKFALVLVYYMSNMALNLCTKSQTKFVLKPNPCYPSPGQSHPTFTAVLPHAQVDLGDVVAAAVAVGQHGHLEDVLLDAGDVVPVVTQHPGQRGLLQLGQLGRGEHAWVLIPEPKEEEGRRVGGEEWREEEQRGHESGVEEREY